MPPSRLKIRLYVTDDLTADRQFPVSGNSAHYLSHVMRCAPGDEIAVFNGRDGEWRAEIDAIGKRDCLLRSAERLRPQSAGLDLWLLFAPVKRAGTDFLVQKATELGVAVLQPVTTRRAIADRVNLERVRANAIEAAEQCGRLTVPEVRAMASLPDLLAAWPNGRRLLFCDEAGAAPPMPAALADAPAGDWAVLVGPEGGFEADERDRLRGEAFVTPASLGPRILRAETAALAALTLWQGILGDCR